MPAPKDPIKNIEWRQKLAESKRGKKLPPFSDAHKKKIGDAQRGSKNHNFGKHQSKETIMKRIRKGISNHNFGKKMSQEQREKISNSKKGKKRSKESCVKQSETMKGKHWSEEVKKKISESNRGKSFSPEHCKKISESKLGKHTHTIESRRKISEANKGKKLGVKHPLWKGGISFEPYCPKFNKEFKERVRAFFNYQCTECGTPQNGKRLHVHHVNFNKMSCCDNTPPLFVALCGHCHTATNSHRAYWEQHFTEMIEGYYQGQCYLPAPVIQ